MRRVGIIRDTCHEDSIFITLIFIDLYFLLVYFEGKTISILHTYFLFFNLLF